LDDACVYIVYTSVDNVDTGAVVSPKTFLGEFEQMVLLAVLQQGDSAFALEVRREIERSADRDVSRGAFYTTLDRLERKGLVTWSEASSDDPRRSGALRRFSVTPSGLLALRESRAALDALSRGLDDVLGGV
jgi:DNA-binding PadR family transcriptional regulator